jgi:hypothetical protein
MGHNSFAHRVWSIVKMKRSVVVQEEKAQMPSRILVFEDEVMLVNDMTGKLRQLDYEV